MKGFFNTSADIYKHEKENGLLPQPAEETKKKAENTEIDEPVDEPTEPTEPTEPVDEPTDPAD